MNTYIYIYILALFINSGMQDVYYDYDCIDQQESNQKLGSIAKISTQDFVGSNLFSGSKNEKKCFTTEDIALLATRKEFESLVPKNLPKLLLDDNLVDILMQYFFAVNKIILRATEGEAKTIAQKAFYDSLGGYLNFYLLPLVKLSFYGGVVTLTTTENVNKLFQKCKQFLNTNGNNWKDSYTHYLNFDLKIESLGFMIETNIENSPAACVSLMLEDCNTDKTLIVSLPKLESEDKGLLTNIWLPFKKKRIFNLRSTAYILMRYFVAVTKCYQYQGIDQNEFNNRFKDWLDSNIEIHLNDEIIYPGLGGILRILETLNIPKHKIPYNEESFTQNRKQISSKSTNLQIKHSINNKLNDGFFSKIFGSYAEDNLENDFPEYEDINTKLQRKQKFYIIITISIILILFFIILIIAILKKRINKGKNAKNSKINKNGKHKEGFFNKFNIFRKKRYSNKANPIDEEFVIDEESSSVFSTNGSKRKKKSTIAEKNNPSLVTSKDEKINNSERKYFPACCGRQNKSEQEIKPTRIITTTKATRSRHKLTEETDQESEIEVSSPVNTRVKTKNIPVLSKKLQERYNGKGKKFSISKKTVVTTASLLKKNNLPNEEKTLQIGMPVSKKSDLQIVHERPKSKLHSSSWETINDKK